MPQKAARHPVLAFAAASVLLVASVTASGQAARPDAASIASSVETLVAQFMADAAPAGVSIAVVRGTDTLVMKGWGLADRGTNRAVTADTSFRLGSVSKQFTAAAIMRLVDQRRLVLGDTIGQHLPQLPVKWRGVTITQLLNHTAGIPNFTDTGSRHWAKKLAPIELVGLVADKGLDFEAGTKYAYSNTGYVILAMLLETLHRRPLAQVIDDELVKPLGLSHTRFCEDELGANGQAKNYVRDGARVVDAPYRSVTHSFGAGGVCSTAGEVAVWNRALHGGRVVSAASYALMTTPQGAAETERYGFGLRRAALAGRPAILHTGLVPGFISLNNWLPGEALSVTILLNTSPTRQSMPLQRDLIRLALGLPVTIATPTNQPVRDAAQLRPYVGTYTIKAPGQPQELRFWVDGKDLQSQATGQSTVLMRPVGEHAFGTAADWTIRITFIVENGKATRLTLEQGGLKINGVRRK